MNALEAAVRDIIVHLDDAGRSWALVGGLAVSARAEPRTTRDVDVVVTVEDDPDAESVTYALHTHGGYDVVTVVEQTSTGRLATVRLRPRAPRTRSVIVDVLFASSGIEGEVVESAQRLEILPGLVVPVATVGHLIALKLLARDDRHRPQDFDDLMALLSVAAAEDVEQARSAVDLIERRGYSRERALRAQLEAILAQGTAGGDGR